MSAISKVYKTTEPTVAKRLQKFVSMQHHYGGDITCRVMNLGARSVVITTGDVSLMQTFLEYAERWVRAGLLSAASESEEMGV